MGTHNYKDFAPTEDISVLSNVQTPKLRHYVPGRLRSLRRALQAGVCNHPLRSRRRLCGAWLRSFSPYGTRQRLNLYSRAIHEQFVFVIRKKVKHLADLCDRQLDHSLFAKGVQAWCAAFLSSSGPRGAGLLPNMLIHLLNIPSIQRLKSDFVVNLQRNNCSQVLQVGLY